MDELKRLKELADQLPEGLRADWRGTNHFELTESNSKPGHGSYWWLDLREWGEESASPRIHEAEDCEECQRVGLLLDLAEEVSRLKPVLESLTRETEEES